MIKKLVILATLLLVSIPACAEIVDTAWVRRYNGPGNGEDHACALAVDSSGNVYVTGWSVGSRTYDDYATIKYYANGDTAWVRRYNGPGDTTDDAFAIAVDISGNVYVTGASVGNGTESDYCTIKYDSNGNIAWVRRYNGPGNGEDYAYALAVDSSGNVYVTGWSYSSETSLDYATIKYYPNGDTAWLSRYNGPGNSDDYAHAIALVGSGNVYVTGGSVGSGTDEDYATIKYYANGDTDWVRRYDGPIPFQSYDYATAIVVDRYGNVYVTGSTCDYLLDYDYATIKYYSNGDTAWLRIYDGPGNGEYYEDYAYAIAVDDSGSVYVTGESVGSGTGWDYATIKYYTDGDTAWVRRYNGPANSSDWAWAIAVDNSCNVYVTGMSMSYNPETLSDDYATVKYYPNGDTAWIRSYNGPGNIHTGWCEDIAQAITVDDYGNVYVTGYSQDSVTGYDYCTIKYVQKTSDVKDETSSKEKPAEFGLSQNYPNPFNQATKIEFTLAKSGFVTLQIYDTLGRKVRTLVSEHLSSGYKSMFWDGKNDTGKEVASGIYFYQIKAGNFSASKKMLLLK
jgi:hypothetical protein